MMSRFLSGLLLSVLLASCTSTAPTAQQLDALEQKVRADYQPQYAALENRRQRGEIPQEEYLRSRTALDQRVQNQVDTMAWSRHALVQSDLKANGIPTPDRPVENAPPGVGTVQNSLYSSSRQNGMGNQVMGNFMRDFGGSNFNSNRAGTMYDPQ